MVDDENRNDEEEEEEESSEVLGRIGNVAERALFKVCLFWPYSVGSDPGAYAGGVNRGNVPPLYPSVPPPPS